MPGKTPLVLIVASWDRHPIAASTDASRVPLYVFYHCTLLAVCKMCCGECGGPRTLLCTALAKAGVCGDRLPL